MHVKEWKRESGEVIGIPFGRRIFYMSVPSSLAAFSSSSNIHVPEFDIEVTTVATCATGTCTLPSSPRYIQHFSKKQKEKKASQLVQVIEYNSKSYQRDIR